MNFVYVTHQPSSHTNKHEFLVSQSSVNWVYCMRGDFVDYRKLLDVDFKKYDTAMIFFTNLTETIQPYLQFVERHPCRNIIIYLDGPVGVHCATMLPLEKLNFMKVLRKADYVFTWAEEADSYFEVLTGGKPVHHVNIPYPLDYIKSIRKEKRFKNEIVIEMGKGYGGRRYERNALGSWGAFAEIQKRFPEVRALCHPNHDPNGSGEQRVNNSYMEEIFGMNIGTSKSEQPMFLESQMEPWMHYVRKLSPCYMAIHLDMLYTRGQFPLECLPPGQKIVSNKGLIPIETIKSDDHVLTHRGRFKRVKKVFSRNYTGDMIKIDANGWFEPLVVTPEHPIHCVEVLWKRTHHGFINGKDTFSYKRIVGQPEWVKAKDLKIPKNKSQSERKGLFLVYPNRWKTQDKKKLNVEYRKFENDPRNRKPVLVKTVFPFESALCKLIGYYLSEGSISYDSQYKHIPRTIELSFGKGDIEIGYARDAEKSAQELGLPGGVKACGSSVNKCLIFSRPLAMLLRDNFGTLAHGKFLPSWVFGLPARKLKLILECYLRGDGSARRGRWRATTVSENLAWGIGQIANILGYRASFGHREPRDGYIGDRKYHSRGCFEINLNEGAERKTINYCGNLFLRVQKVEVFQYEGSVHNMAVEEDESYCLPYSTVHNCAGVGIPCICSGSDAGRKLFPKTYLKNPFDIKKATEIGIKLIENSDFYDEVVAYADNELENHSYKIVHAKVLEILGKMPEEPKDEQPE